MRCVHLTAATTFTGAQTARVNWEGTDFRTANWGQIDFTQADLSNVNLSGLDLRAFPFSSVLAVGEMIANGSNLAGVDLTENDNNDHSQFVGADLSGAKLGHSYEANFTGANLTGTEFLSYATGAQFNRATLTGTIFDAQVDQSDFYQSTGTPDESVALFQAFIPDQWVFVRCPNGTWQGATPTAPCTF